MMTLEVTVDSKKKFISRERETIENYKGETRIEKCIINKVIWVDSEEGL